ncbi:hypothetical protein [Blastococcus sp. Marseille-P5729]|uniref:hypothetical protein n=1 Tax=Blastococcus sp. Marseille-P5729 TaxID=2086582 RepID=UPI000D0E3CFA|nr:hypothetical protein [Blastococcus sp. Marseille-P5729]
MSAAEIIPIALVLDERTGYTLWAPPWEEDGEVWQAFLGKEDKILLFTSPAQLAQFIRDEDDHDLADHPEWEEWEDSDPFELVPDDDHVFDLDGVYELVASRPDRWSVNDLGRTLGIVDSIAQCCDEEILEPVADTPELGLVADGPGAFTGRGGDRAWDKIAIAISGQWESVCERVGDWIDWREPVTLDDELAEAQREIDATTVPVDDPDALIEAEEEARDEDDDEGDYLGVRDAREQADLEDEDLVSDDSDDDDDPSDDDDSDDDRDDDTDDDVQDVDADDLAYRPLSGSSSDDDDDEIDAETAYAFWEESGILPVRVRFPKEDFDNAEAYTLRCYLEDKPVFLGSSLSPWMCSSSDGLLDVIEDEDQNDIEKPGHDLRDLATWPTVVGAVRDEDMPLAIANEDDVDLEAADAMLRGEVDFDPAIVAAAADLLLDLSEYGELDGSRELLDGDGDLADVLSAARDGEVVRIDDDESDALDEWEKVLREVASIIEWTD